MFIIRRFFHKAATISESETASNEKLSLFQTSEKARLLTDYIPPPPPPPKHQTKCGKLRSVSKLLLSVAVVFFVFFSGHSIKDSTFLGYKALLQNNDGPNNVACNHDASTDEPISISASPWTSSPINAKILNRDGWNFSCSSNSKDNNHNCNLAFDGNINTFWQSADDTRGHWIEIDLKSKVNVHSLAVKPILTQKTVGGSVRKHRVEVAIEKGSWELVALGTWRDSDGVNYATFEPRPAQFVRLLIDSTTQGKNYATVSEINVFAVDVVEGPVTKGGRWNITLNFPLVPVTVFLDPKTQNVITMASFAENNYNQGPEKFTFSATWNPKTGMIEEERLDQTGHDMFCPGTSYDENGRVIITGGSTPSALSVYDPNTVGNSYYTPKNNSNGQPITLQVPRGYHGQTFLPSGKTFMIGGSWSGSVKGDTNADRDGEVFDPARNVTTKLNNVPAKDIKMDVSVSSSLTCRQPHKIGPPCEMVSWQQHHAWLFAWKNDSIFHAGPSKRMNWIFTEPTDGLISGAGLRKDDDKNVAHGDAVCGVTAMYDAENGVILTAGGAPNYNYWHDSKKTKATDDHREQSTNLTFEIRLAGVKPGDPVHPKLVAPMKRQRIFANAVVLPNGETFVVGGQIEGEPFFDDTWQEVPEIYSPDSKTWRDAARHSTPRVYHSWAMLLPDASVLVGGSGLNNRPTDHYDAQIYQPAYLFGADGKTPAKQPKITGINQPAAKYKVGGVITLTTDVPIDAASLTRYSATTHTVNNDQRRIKLNVTTVGNPADKKYTVAIPADPGVTLPGYWMLFVLAKGVPSVAQTVQILK